MRNALMTSTLLVLALSLVPVHQASADDEPTKFSLETALKMATVGGPRVSPDGKYVAYTVDKADAEKDEYRSQVMMVPLDGGEAIELTGASDSSSSPRWSPDGRYLTFLSARDDGKTQVWRLYREGGEAQQITDTPQSVLAYEWSPDSKRLLLELKDPSKAELAAAEGEDADEMTQPPWEIDRLQFKTDYVGYLDRRRRHVHALDIESGELQQLTHGDFDASEARWSPDGSRIAFTSNRTEEPDSNYNTDIWTVSSTPDGKPPVQVTATPGADDSPVWAPDGQSIIHRTISDKVHYQYATLHLAETPAGGGQTRVLTESLDRWVYDPMVSGDGAWIWFILEDNGESQLARISRSDGRLERPITGRDAVHAFHFNGNDELAVNLSRSDLRAEIFSGSPDKLDQITFTNQDLLKNVQWAELSYHTFQNKDGIDISGFVFRPPGFERGVRYPVILDIHGGPVSQYDNRFSTEAQLLAAQGYVVVFPNPQGSSGYGEAFSAAIWRDWGGPDFYDVMAAVDDVIDKGWGDRDRMGVMGWSYGGMLTNHIITKTDRFDAAVTGASATLYVANYGHDMYQRWWDQEFGFPWEPEAREIYETLSPFNQLDKVTTPTLIMGGEEDWNVPILNSEQLYLALKKLDVDTKLIVYPGEYHGISTPSYVKHMYQSHFDWFAKYLQ